MQPVGARRAAVVAGGLVAICVAVLFCVRVVPGRVISLLGGPSKSVERWGGVRVMYEPPPESDAAIEEYLRTQAHVERTGKALLLEFPDIAIDDVNVNSLTDVLVAGGLSMKLALEDDWAARIAANNELVISERYDENGDPYQPDDPRARLEIDYWVGEEDGSRHSTPYLIAPTRGALDAAIEAARARGFQMVPGTEIRFEDIEFEYRNNNGPAKQVRAYSIASEVLISGTMVDDAVGSFEPNTGRPVVLLDFTQEGGELFCDLTHRIAGKKLALMLGGKVRSAPIINGAICGGRASITMGGADPDQQLRERDMIVEVLRHGALPTGGTIRNLERIEPAETTLQTLLGRLLLGLLFGLLAGAVTFAVVRFARPSSAPATHGFTGTFPWRRLLVTAAAPMALIAGKRLTLPGINEAELDHITRGASMDQSTVIALGLTPIFVGYFLVEVFALAIPPLRWRRHDPTGRIALGKVAALLAIVVALVYGYFIARYLESASAMGAEIVSDPPGWRFRLMLMISVTAGSLLLAVIAGVISEHGLGNGYGVLAASAIVLDIIPDLDFVNPFTAEFALGVIVFAAITTAACFVLRWRVAEGKQPPLRIPTSGISPLADTGAFIGLVFGIFGLAGNATLFDLLIWSDVLNGWKVRLALVALTIPLWAWLFARPSAIARVALQGGLEPSTTATWLRATAASALLVLAPALLTAAVTLDPAMRVLVNPISALLVGAVLLDVIADARARRAKLVVAGVIHQVQYLGAVEHALVEASIPFHTHASHLRTLFAFFAPWAPVHVLVPDEHAIEARLKIDGVLRSARGTVPEARAV